MIPLLQALRSWLKHSQVLSAGGFMLLALALWSGSMETAHALDPFGQNTSVLDPVYRESFEDSVGDGNLVSPDTGTGTIGDIRDLFFNSIVPIFQYIFIFLGVAFWVYYVIRILSARGSADEIGQFRRAILYGVLGFAAVSLAIELAQVLAPIQTTGGTVLTTSFAPQGANPETGTAGLIDIGGAQNIIQRVIFFLQIVAGVIALGALFYTGVRMITSGGNDDAVSEAQKYFVWSAVGLIIIMLSVPLVNTVFYPSVDATLGQAELVSFTQQFVGLLEFVLQFLGAAALLSFLAAGFFYLTSFGNDEQTSRARGIMITSGIGIIVILSSFALLSLFSSP